MSLEPLKVEDVDRVFTDILVGIERNLLYLVSSVNISVL